MYKGTNSIQEAGMAGTPAAALVQVMYKRTETHLLTSQPYRVKQTFFSNHIHRALLFWLYMRASRSSSTHVAGY